MKTSIKKAIEIIDRLYDRKVVRGHRIMFREWTMGKARTEMGNLICYKVEGATNEYAVQVNDEHHVPYMMFIYER